MNQRAAIVVLSFLLTMPLLAQEIVPESRELAALSDSPITTHGSAGRLAFFTGTGSTVNDALGDSLLTHSTYGVLLSGLPSIGSPRIFMQYAIGPGNGSDLTGLMGDSQTFSVGFNSEAAYSGTVGTLSGRTFYVYDRSVSTNRLILDGQGTWWFGPSSTNYSLKVLAPSGGAVTGMTIDAAGNVSIGGATDAAYKLRVHGAVKGNSIEAHFQDVAEWVPSATDLEPGTVVILDPHANNTVTASRKPYDTTVAGVVSEQPGLILGTGSPSKEQVATTGRVRVKVDASHGPVRIGDLLVTGDRPGMAMKSVPVEVSGITMHRPGTIIGKALEPLERGEGEILVLLSLQ